MDIGMEIRGVTKTFGALQALNTIDFNIKSGEFISIVGKSGCGKSTLLRILSGLETATQGTVSINGRKVTRPTVEKGMIFQEPRLFPWLSVTQNIEFGIHQKTGKAGRNDLVMSHIELVGLTGFENAYPRQLSGGMQQRVSIARALINRPSVLLLDEPFGALDALTRINMQNEILRIWEKEKTMMILVTHDIDEAIFLSDRIIVMSDRPGSVKKTLGVNLSRPRDRSSSHFMEIRREIYTEFFEDSPLSLEIYI